MIVVTFHLTAKNSEEFLQHLAQVLHVTRVYQGCRYLSMLVQANHFNKVILV